MTLENIFKEYDKQKDGAPGDGKLDYYEFTNLLYYSGSDIFPALAQVKISHTSDENPSKAYAESVLEFAQTRMAEIAGAAPDTPVYNCAITLEALEKYVSENRHSLDGRYIERIDVVAPELPEIQRIRDITIER